VEKFIKAALVARGQEFPKTHDLLALNELCSQASVFLAIAPDQLANLSLYAVEVRYPGEDRTLDEAREALEIAKHVRRVIRKLLGVK
jgi:HEPN domain-containing protein